MVMRRVMMDAYQAHQPRHVAWVAYEKQQRGQVPKALAVLRAVGL